MIYDCFNFLYEDHLLEIRIEELKNVVDKFVICESDITVSNIKKPFFLENSEVYKKYKDKIIYLKLEIGVRQQKTSFYDHSNEDRHSLMFNQRNMIKQALNNCNDDDVIMFSDLDEIPSEESILKNIINNPNKNFPFSLDLRGFFWYFNTTINSPSNHYWFPSVVCDFYKNIKHKSLNEVRQSKDFITRIPNCGWHFSHLGDENQLSYKMMASSHSEYHSPEYLAPENIKKRREALTDPYDRAGFEISKNESHPLPKYIQENRNKFSKYLK